MAGGKEIRSKIKSIKNTQKITKAMEMVAASKMRRAQDQMLASRPYARGIRRVAAHLAQAQTEVIHPYLSVREVKRVGLIVVSSDRGLCGGLNNNLFKLVTQNMMQWQADNVEVDIICIGQKSISFFKRFGGNVLDHLSQLGDHPEMAHLLGVIKIMLDAYSDGRIDRLYLAGNLFVNTMTQAPRLVPMLPLPDNQLLEEGQNHNGFLHIADDASNQLTHNWDYLYEPDPQTLLGFLLNRYIEALIYQAVVENLACEMSARMVAMKAASDNAGSLIDELQLIYNKARQTAITQELSEIVGGAAAV